MAPLSFALFRPRPPEPLQPTAKALGTTEALVEPTAGNGTVAGSERWETTAVFLECFNNGVGMRHDQLKHVDLPIIVYHHNIS